MPEETLNEVWRDIFADLREGGTPPQSAAAIARRAVETHTETLTALRALVWDNEMPEAYHDTLRHRLRVERERMQSAKHLKETTEHQSAPLTRHQQEALERVTKLLQHTQHQNEELSAYMGRHR